MVGSGLNINLKLNFSCSFKLTIRIRISIILTFMSKENFLKNYVGSASGFFPRVSDPDFFEDWIRFFYVGRICTRFFLIDRIRFILEGRIRIRVKPNRIFNPAYNTARGKKLTFEQPAWRRGLYKCRTHHLNVSRVFCTINYD